MANSNRRGPRPLCDILSELFTLRGYGRLRALSELERVWNTAVGEPHCHQTRVGDVRRGVLTVTVAHPTLLEELAAFRKPLLLQVLRMGALGSSIRDIRFRVGPIEELEPTRVKSLPTPSSTSSASRRSKANPGTVGKGRRSRNRSDNRNQTVEED